GSLSDRAWNGRGCEVRLDMGLVLRLVGARGEVLPRRLLLTAVALALAGCGSLGGGSSDRLSITSTPPGADVTASTGESCLTPCTMALGRGADFTVVISKRGFKSERFPVGENCARTIDIALRPISSILG